MFATSFTATMLTVSVRAVAAELHCGVGLVAWSVTGSLFASAVSMPILGRLGDLRGHRRVFLVGTGFAVVFAVATAFAFDPVSLIAVRVGAALAGAATTPSTFAMLFTVFPPEERVRPAAWASAVFSASGVTGLAVGGVVMSTIGWRPMFVAQGAFALAALVLALRVLPAMPSDRAAGADGAARPSLDRVGAVLLALTTFALTFGVNRAAVSGASPLVIGLLVAVVPLAWLLTRVERRAAVPVLPLRLLRERDILNSSAASFLTNGAHLGNFLVTPLLLESVFGLSLMWTSVVTIARTLTVTLAAPVASRLGSRFGPARLALVGIVAYVAALVVLAAGTQLGLLWLVVVGLLTSGLAYGHSVPPLLVIATNASPSDSFGLTTSLQQTTNQIGGVVGMSLMTAIAGAAVTRGPFAEAYLAAAVMAAISVVAGVILAVRHRRRAYQLPARSADGGPGARLDDLAEPGLAAPVGEEHVALS
jgi:MFS family permease